MTSKQSQLTLFNDSRAQLALPNLEPPFRVEPWPDDDVSEYLVSLAKSGDKLACSCPAFGRYDYCSHVHYLQDIWFGDGKSTGAYWLVKSAFHKELRRGDLERALSYGRLFKQLRNNSTVKRYVYSIIPEETRNIELLEWASRHVTGREADWIDFTLRMVASIKKWEVPCLAETEELLVRQRAQPPLEPSIDEVISRCRAMESLAEGYRLFPSISGKEKHEAMMGQVLMSGLPREVARTLERYFRRAKIGFNANQTMLDLLLVPEAIDEGAKFPHPVKLKDELDDFHPFRDSAFDNHVRLGIRRLKADPVTWWDGRQAKGIDLRWSGIQLGNLWRYLAAHSGQKHWREMGWTEPFELHPAGDELYAEAVELQARLNERYFVKRQSWEG